MKLRNYLTSLSLIFFLVLGVTTQALGAQLPPAFMTLDGKTSKVLTLSFGASNPSTGGASGSADFSDIDITRLIDSQSPALLLHVATGKHFASVVIERGTLKITLTNVTLSSYAMNSPTVKKRKQTEAVTLIYNTITYEVGGESSCWDISLNISCS